MRRAAAAAIALLLTLVLAACGGGTDPTAPPASVAGSQPASPGTPVAEGCEPSSDPAAVTVQMANFAFDPAEVSAAVNDTISWENGDAAPHTATLDDGSCETGNIPTGGAGGLVFHTAGTFEYHCAIHPTMTASITITE
jgi:plastocyanin